MLIKEIPKSERPRERLIKYGVSNLSNEELLAIFLKTGSKGISVKELSINILQRIKKIENLKNIDIHTFDGIKGIGEVKKEELLVLSELGKRIYLSSGQEALRQYINPSFIYNDNKYLFYGLKQEYFYVMYLDNKKNLIERKLLFMGTIDRSLIHPREVFKNAYLCSASSFICMHNHPSGDVKPSKADLDVTKMLMEIGRIQGIDLLDHIIVSDKNYFSFFEPFYFLKDIIYFPVKAKSDLSISRDLQDGINEELKKEYEELKKINDLSSTLVDFDSKTGVVVERNKMYWFNTITINLGSKDGIKEDMAVISSDGLIGKISKVGSRTSLVKLITTNVINSKISVTIKLKDTKVYGIMSGYKDNDNLLEVTSTNKNLEIEKGSKVYTSGMGGVFPSGILIGEVSSIEKDKYDVSKIINVTPASNFSDFNFVKVLIREN